MNSQGCWQGAFVEGHGYVIPDAFVITSYLRGSELGSDWEGYEWNEDDAGNHLPNPSPDEINNNGNAEGGYLCMDPHNDNKAPDYSGHYDTYTYNQFGVHWFYKRNR